MSSNSPANQKSCAICYVADRHYILPTLISIKSLRQYNISVKADIIVFTLGLDPQMYEHASSAFATLGATLIRADPTRISGFDPSKYNVTHVPQSALGRFFLTDMIPSTYDKIVYIDGDTWFSKDPSPLFTLEVPRGYIAAAEDPSFFYRGTIGATGKSVRSYFSHIGIDGRKGYFNSGVLASDFETFANISHLAFEYFVKNTANCRYHDQSALNVVCQDCRIRLSPRWNFATAYSLWGSDAVLDPVIYHFTGGAKPWLGLDESWPRIRSVYQEQTSKIENLSLFRQSLSLESIKEGNKATKAYILKLRTILLPRALLYRRHLFQVYQNSILR